MAIFLNMIQGIERMHFLLILKTNPGIGLARKNLT